MGDKTNDGRSRFIALFRFSSYNTFGRICLAFLYLVGSLFVVRFSFSNSRLNFTEASIAIHNPYWVCPIPLQPFAKPSELAVDEYPKLSLVLWSTADPNKCMAEISVSNNEHKYFEINVETKVMSVLPSWPKDTPWYNYNNMYSFSVKYDGQFKTTKRRFLAGFPIPNNITTHSFKTFTGNMIIEDRRDSGIVPLAIIKYNNSVHEMSPVNVGYKGHYLLFSTYSNRMCPVLYFFRHNS